MRPVSTFYFNLFWCFSLKNKQTNKQKSLNLIISRIVSQELVEIRVVVRQTGITEFFFSGSYFIPRISTEAGETPCY